MHQTRNFEEYDVRSRRDKIKKLYKHAKMRIKKKISQLRMPKCKHFQINRKNFNYNPYNINGEALKKRKLLLLLLFYL